MVWLICLSIRVTLGQGRTDDVVALINELRSDAFERREAATRALVAAGPAAIEPLAEAAEGANLELALRAVQVLYSMCLSDDDATWQAAEEALRKTASGSAEVASRCAQDILTTMPASALSRLRTFGAVVTDGASITFNESWRGGDEGLINLRWMPRLTTLWISGAPIGDRALQHLRWVPRLRDLAIRDVPITDGGLEHLKWVPRLQNIYLNQTQVTDAGLQHLAGRSTLKALELESPGITDAGVDILCELTSLRTISIRGTKISEEGIARLKKALVSTRVKTDKD